MNLSFSQLEAYLVHHLSKVSFLNYHFDHPISQRITVVGFIILIFIIVYKIVHRTGVSFGLWETADKDFRFDHIPVHCAHLYVHGYVVDEKGCHDSLKLRYHIEFSPEEYHPEDPELGSTLGFLRKKLYFLFKDSSIYEDLKLKRVFRIEDVVLFDSRGNLLENDSKPLCLHGVETGQRINAHFKI